MWQHDCLVKSKQKWTKSSLGTRLWIPKWIFGFIRTGVKDLSRLATSLTYFITSLMGEKFAGNNILWLVVL